MARNLALKTNVEPVDSDYPFGRIKDDDGSGNGTPVDEAVYGDFHQFFAKLFADSKLTYNNLPDNDYSGFQFIQALQKTYKRSTGVKTISSATALTNNDRNKLIYCNGASSYIVNLLNSNNLLDGESVIITNANTGGLDIRVASGSSDSIGDLGNFQFLVPASTFVSYIELILDKPSQTWILSNFYFKESAFVINKITVGSGGSAPAFVSPWASGMSLPDVKFFKDEKGFVHLTGAASISVALSGNEIIFTLPTGYRPTEDMSVAVPVVDDSSIAIGSLIIQSDGTVIINPGNLTASTNLTVNFDCIDFYTAW